MRGRGYCGGIVIGYMKKKSMGNSLLLLLTAFIWGVAFVAQSVGMDYIGPFSFNGARFLMGSLVLLPLIYVRRKSSLKSGISGKADDWRWRLSGLFE